MPANVPLFNCISYAHLQLAKKQLKGSPLVTQPKHIVSSDVDVWSLYIEAKQPNGPRVEPPTVVCREGYRWGLHRPDRIY